MLQSMTGFSRREADISPYGRVFLEAKSLNHRFVEVDVRVPRFLSSISYHISEMVKNRFSRGKFSISLRFTELGRLPAKLVFNDALFREYLEVLRNIGRQYGVSGSVSIGDVPKLDGVFSLEGDQPDEELEQKVLEEVDALLSDLAEDRLREGRNLARDIEERISVLESIVSDIKALSENQVKACKDAISKRVSEICGGLDVDPGRLEQEVAFLASRMDITEELVRMESHISAFRKALGGSSPVGRRLDFIAQELLREINTIGSKAYIPEISSKVVDFKDELEKIRQQVQNLE